MCYPDSMMTVSTDQQQSSIRDLRQSLGISQNELAIQSGVSRHSVIRLEQLCYPTPLPSIVSLLSDAIGTSEALIREAYLRDVTLNRMNTAQSVFNNHKLLHALARLSTTRPLSTKHPFQIWRESVCARNNNISISRIHFSKLTSIHPATVFKYETFKTGFPHPIEVVFKELGMPPELINVFHTPPFNTTK